MKEAEALIEFYTRQIEDLKKENEKLKIINKQTTGYERKSKEPLELWQLDINKTYIIDEDVNVFEDLDHFHEYHFDSYEGIKDNYEQWQEQIEEEHQTEEMSGREIMAILYNELMEMNNYWKNRYYETMGENSIDLGDYVVPESPAIALARKYGKKIEGENK